MPINDFIVLMFTNNVFSGKRMWGQCIYSTVINMTVRVEIFERCSNSRNCKTIQQEEKKIKKSWSAGFKPAQIILTRV
jgi:hypothetical protein